MAVSTGPNFSAKAIAEAEFPSAFRGYDTEAVREFLQDVADTFDHLEQLSTKSTDSISQSQLRELKKENLRLRSKLKTDPPARNSPAAVVDLQDDQVAAVLGKEATRILEAARAAAADIIDRANDDSNDIKQQAQIDASKIIDEAGRVMEQRRSEAELAATKTLAIAQKQAGQVKEAAKIDYDAIRSEVSQAMTEAKRVLKAQEALSAERSEKVIADADAYRKQAITELLHQRRTGADELTALLETRDSLAESIARAQRQIDDLSVDLEEVNSRPKVVAASSNFEHELTSVLAELDQQAPEVADAPSLASVHSDLDSLEMNELDLSSLDSELTEADLADVRLELEQEKSLEDFIDLEVATSLVDREHSAASIGSTPPQPSPSYLDHGDLWNDNSGTSDEIQVTFTDTDPVGFESDLYIAPDVDSEITLVNGDSDWDEIVTTVSGRSYGTVADETRGDLPSMEPVSDAVPEIFKDRDVALSRLGPDLRRKIKRALNDDQSEVLDRIRRGTGSVAVNEIPTTQDQLVHYFEPLRENLTRVADSGASIAGGEIDHAAIEAIALQIAKHLVISVRIPTIEWLEKYDGSDREAVLDPIRAIYRDYRNHLLSALLEDALFEVFAIGHYMALGENSETIWLPDPRLEPDPLCEINARTSGLRLGEIYPSGHSRPLSLPGCRCLLVSAN